jgi:hypothetical protein
MNNQYIDKQEEAEKTQVAAESSLRNEPHGLSKDAVRYRWLRDFGSLKNGYQISVWLDSQVPYEAGWTRICGAAADNNIDRAIALWQKE